MKPLLITAILLSSISYSSASDVITETSKSSSSLTIDGKKSRKSKKMNKKRKRACASWGKQSFAG